MSSLFYPPSRLAASPLASPRRVARFAGRATGNAQPGRRGAGAPRRSGGLDFPRIYHSCIVPPGRSALRPTTWCLAARAHPVPRCLKRSGPPFLTASLIRNGPGAAAIANIPATTILCDRNGIAQL